MWPHLAMAAEIAVDRRSGFGDAGVDSQVDLLVFYCPPEAVDEDLVALGAPAVYTCADLNHPQQGAEVDAGALAALNCAEDLRPSEVGERVIYSAPLFSLPELVQSTGA